MSDRERDEELLIDFVLGRCDEPTADAIRRRLASEAEFAALHENIAATFEALGKYAPPDVPANLVERTMGRLHAMRRSEALLEVRRMRRSAVSPTFSFRELGALAAAAVLVVGILLPSLRHARQRTDQSLCAANVGRIGTALSLYADENGSFPGGGSKGGSWLRLPGMKRASNSAALFLLARQDYAVPDDFQCPAAGGQSFVKQAGMTDFPSPGAVSYSFQHSLDRPIRPEDLAEVSEQMVILADRTPVFPDGLFRRECVKKVVSENHSDGVQNVLYLGLHVRSVRDCRVGVGGNNIFLAEGVYDYTGHEEPVSRTDSFVLPSFGQ